MSHFWYHFASILANEKFQKIDCMLKILNCVPDDKFIDGIIHSFDATTERCLHEYVIISEDNSPNFRYIKLKERILVIKSSDFISYLNTGHFDALIIHGLRTTILNLLPLINKHVIVIWKAWGFDIYTSPHILDPFIKLELYKPLTKRAIRKPLLSRLRELHGFIFYLQHKRFIHRAISRINLFSGVLQCEYDMMSKLNYFKAERIYYPYISLTSCPQDDYSSPGPNILVGNSNDPSNNHLDIFEVLKQADIGQRIIYCPLNYGGSNEYKQRVINAGKQYWGDAFVPLTTYLPQEEYFQIIKSCSITIFNHERQQALGNISSALANGCSIYLSQTSVNYRELSQEGYKLFDIIKDLPQLLELNESEIQINRNIAKRQLSTEFFLKEVYEMYDRIEYMKTQNHFSYRHEKLQ